MGKSLAEKLGKLDSELAEELESLLNQDWSMPRLARRFGCSSTTIHNLIRKYDLMGRRANVRNREWLFEEYIGKEKSSIDIANETGLSDTAIRQLLTKHGIPVRTLSEAQQLGNRKRFVSPLHRYCSRRSYGYCVHYGDIFLRSAAELLWATQHEGMPYEYEPFVFENKRPDFKLDNVVYEVKSKRQSMNDDAFVSHIDYGNRLTNVMGYEYRLLFMADLFPSEYRAIIEKIKQKGGKAGVAGVSVAW